MTNNRNDQRPTFSATKLTRLFFLTLLIAITMTLFVACGQKQVTLEDMVNAEIYYKDVNEDLLLVSSISDPKGLETYLDTLLLSEPSGAAITSDLHYILNLRTRDSLNSYALSFNLSDHKATASNEKGTYEIPFEWVNGYLDALQLSDHFPHLAAPTFDLFIEDKALASTEASDDTPYRIATSMDLEWVIQPTVDIGYTSRMTIPGGEQLTRESTDIAIYGDFSHNPPDAVDLTISNSYDDTQVTKTPISLDKGSKSLSLTLPDMPGNYSYLLECQWNQPEKGYQGTIDYGFDLTINTPISYKIGDGPFMPGDTIPVLIRNAKSLDYRVETKLYDKTVGLFYLSDEEAPVSVANPRDLIGFVPLSSWATPGDYQIDFYVDSTDELLVSFPYTVAKMDFPRQDLTVSTSTADLKSNNNSELDRIKFKPARDYSVGQKLWDGPFLQPVEGRITTEYATNRFVNGSKTESSRHNAIDIAAPQGTPIKAANNGIVTFADDLIISGNVVVLDHGYGIFSSYIHMHAIYVEVGQEIKKGEILGEVGTTGYSTGPHLHWSIWKNGVYLNPWTFVDHDPIADFID